MNKEDINILIQIRQYLIFELHRNIKEFGGAANFKTEDAIKTLDKIIDYLEEKEWN